MYDAVTSALIAQAPALDGLKPANLREELTEPMSRLPPPVYR